MVIFVSISEYFSSCKSDKAKLAAINTIIDKVLVSAALAAEKSDIDEYWWDDGHVKIRTKYRNTTEVAKAIQSWESIRQIYINRLVGRGVRLMDSSNFNGNGGR